MNWLDTRTKEQKLNDEVWRRQGADSERAAILEYFDNFVESDLALTRHNLAIILDEISEGKHHD